MKAVPKIEFSQASGIFYVDAIAFDLESKKKIKKVRVFEGDYLGHRRFIDGLKDNNTRINVWKNGVKITRSFFIKGKYFESLRKFGKFAKRLKRKAALAAQKNNRKGNSRCPNKEGKLKT